eukprot:7386819-Prymnesium_polylepis.1
MVDHEFTATPSRRVTRDVGHETAAVAAPCIQPSELPGHAADRPRPARPTYPHKTGERRSASALLATPAARCSSSSRLPAYCRPCRRRHR